MSDFVVRAIEAAKKIDEAYQMGTVEDLNDALREMRDIIDEIRSERRSRQCQDVFTSTRGRTITHVYCLKRADHDGDHRGERCQWNKSGERVKITEPRPRCASVNQIRSRFAVGHGAPQKTARKTSQLRLVK